MPRRRGKIGARRREQIIHAASAIIAEKGIHELSLSAIENRTDMSRGQLTYYFPTKEAILLAVFDHMLETMKGRAEAGEGPPGCSLADLHGSERIRAFLTFMLLHPPEAPEFHALQYTFLSQIGYRDDFRQRLAGLYETWREGLAGDLPAPVHPPQPPPRALATFIQALLHGLSMQRFADPASYDRDEMLALCMTLLGPYLGPPAGPARAPKRKQKKADAQPLPVHALTRSTASRARRHAGPRSSKNGSDRNGQS